MNESNKENKQNLNQHTSAPACRPIRYSGEATTSRGDGLTAGPTHQREGPTLPGSKGIVGRGNPDQRDPMIVLPKEGERGKHGGTRHSSRQSRHHRPFFAFFSTNTAGPSTIHRMRDGEGTLYAFKSSPSPAGPSSTSLPGPFFCIPVPLGSSSHTHTTVLVAERAGDMELSAKVYLSGQVDRSDDTAHC